MINSKINLFGQNWIDTVFEGRNKKYGAYDLRRKESTTTIKAAVIGALIFTSLVSIPLIVKKIASNVATKEVLDQKITMVDLLPPPEQETVKEFVPPPPPVKEIKSIKDVKKLTAPVVAPEEEVVEEMAKQEEFKTAIAGAQNITGSADGEVVIDEKPVEKPVEQAITEDNDIHPVVTVEVQPEFPGGMDAFDRYIVNNFTDTDIGGMGVVRIIIQFVVEKDGRLTDIKILRDGGYSNVAQEAVRVLSKSPKWKPGILNGRAVRVSYVKPIVIKMQ